jgi:hypothetical protein
MKQTMLMLSLLLLGTTSLADAPPRNPQPVFAAPLAFPSDAECAALPPMRPPFAFRAGETLDYDLDALGAKAGRMTMKVLPLKDGSLPVEIHAETNTFFSKVRRVNGSGTSYLNPKTLRPNRYFEDAMENEVHRVADVAFRPKDKLVHLKSTINGALNEWEMGWGNEGLDVAGTIYLLRQLPFKDGLPVCFDAYGIRRMWRTWGRVVGREHVSLPVGEFEAWHIEGVAARIDEPQLRREIHVWISDDPRRLPLAALGAIDLGTVRATLTGFSRPGDKQTQAESKGNLSW